MPRKPPACSQELHCPMDQCEQSRGSPGRTCLGSNRQGEMHGLRQLDPIEQLPSELPIPVVPDNQCSVRGFLPWGCCSPSRAANGERRGLFVCGNNHGNSVRSSADADRVLWVGSR
ncbi:hypothetical protein L596_012036 [Steinernema carpocapsae]|uniref:Uncharacterized protein n=1 Tax=Steinernema carpocapsae TaxID=34508 RepID=A0A4U5NWP4_STECR|nr:hypothetical protein L596_012036 [Steinernema carpocapsae]